VIKMACGAYLDHWEKYDKNSMHIFAQDTRQKEMTDEHA